MPKIVLKFDKQTGEAKIDAQGFQGSKCKDATKFLKNCLGDMTDYKVKSEYYEVEEGLTLITNLCG